jgi:hypothetical protein
MAMLPPLGKPNRQLADALKQLSAAKYGRPKATVEKEIFARLATIEDTKPAFGAPPAPGAAPAYGAPYPPQAAQPPRPPAPAGSGSFLDEWLAKRKAPAATPYAPPRAFGQATPGQMPPVGAMPAPGAPTAAMPPAYPAPAAPAGPQRPFGRENPFTPGAARPAATPLTPTPAREPAAGHNITSNELDKKEVADIAKEIKSQLDESKDAKPAAKPAEPAKAEEPAKPAAGEIALDAHRTDNDKTAEDTIFIDREGNLSSSDEPSA